MNATPTRPEPKTEEQIVRERLATFDDDEKTAKPWAEVKKAVLESPRRR